MGRISAEELQQLTVAERVRLAEDIWESIAANPESLPIPETQRRELERRLKLHDEDPDSAEPWSLIRSRLLDS